MGHDEANIQAILQIALTKYLLLAIGTGAVSQDPTKEELNEFLQKQVDELWAGHLANRDATEIDVSEVLVNQEDSCEEDIS